MQENRLWNKNGSSAKITWKDWFKLDCLSFLLIIPILGPLLLLGIYLFLLLNKETAFSIRSRIKANLIWSVISLIVGLMAVITSVALFAGIGSTI